MAPKETHQCIIERGGAGSRENLKRNSSERRRKYFSRAQRNGGEVRLASESHGLRDITAGNEKSIVKEVSGGVRREMMIAFKIC